MILEFQLPFSQTFTIITEEVFRFLKIEDAKGFKRHFHKIFCLFYSHPHLWIFASWMFNDFIKGFLEAKQPRKVFEMKKGNLGKDNLWYAA